MVRKEVNPTDWTYEKDGDAIEGVLIRKQSDVGPNNAMLYVLDTKSGIKNVWGATILDSRMALVNIGSRVWITYKGLAEAKDGKNPAKIFKVEIDEEEPAK